VLEATFLTFTFVWQYPNQGRVMEATAGWPARFMEQLLPGHFGVASNNKEEDEMRAVAAQYEISKRGEVQVRVHTF
jgi:hypothetical protein